MSKHLKIKGKLINSNTEVLVELVEQTHTGSTFGRSTIGTSYGHNTFKHGRIILYSYNGIRLFRYYPGGVPSATGEIWFLFESPIKCPESSNNKSFICTLQEWKDLKAAVEAYNQWGEGQP